MSHLSERVKKLSKDSTKAKSFIQERKKKHHPSWHENSFAKAHTQHGRDQIEAKKANQTLRHQVLILLSDNQIFGASKQQPDQHPFEWLEFNVSTLNEWCLILSCLFRPLVHPLPSTSGSIIMNVNNFNAHFGSFFSIFVHFTAFTIYLTNVH